jgi:heat shock protein HspQ
LKSTGRLAPAPRGAQADWRRRLLFKEMRRLAAPEEYRPIGAGAFCSYIGLKEFPPMKARSAKFRIGQVVKHRVFPFRGLIFDVDPEFDNTEEWWLSIPEEVRPRKDQPFYHLFAENSDSEYIAYVSEQNLLPDESGEPLRNPMIGEMFVEDEAGRYRAKGGMAN